MRRCNVFARIMPAVGLVSLISIAGCVQEVKTVSGPAPAAPVAVKTAPAPTTAPKPAGPTRIEAGPDAAKQAQTALITAKPGDVVEFGAGTFDFKSTLSLDVSGVTVRGQGPDKTILRFKDQGQGTGGEGILITSKEKATLEGLAVEDAKGDAIKVNGTRGLVLRNIRTEWTGGPKETNGGYGLYPVLCHGVLIEGCTVRGASDAGIYVGQSEFVIVRHNTVEQNVAGIEIENCTRADVSENKATNNSGGILVFTMPDLPTKDGKQCRVVKNQVIANNHANFAPKGNIVASVPPGTGIMILASDEVEVIDNEIAENQTAGLSIVSYLLTDRPIKDEKFDPFCEAIHIHHNRFRGNGGKPDGEIGLMVAQVVGSPLPDMLYDGLINPARAKDGSLPPELAISIHDNGDASFVNFDAAGMRAAAAGGTDKAQGPKPNRDLKPYGGKLPSLAPVVPEWVD